MVTITMMMTTTKRRTTWLIAEDPEICLLVVRSPALLFKTLVATPPTLRTSSRTFLQRQRRMSAFLHSMDLNCRQIRAWMLTGNLQKREACP